MIVHYIAEYFHEKNERNLYGSPAGITKMNYIIKSIQQAGYPIKVFSTSRTLADRKFFGIKKEHINDRYGVVFRSTFCALNKYSKRLERLWAQLQILVYGLLFVKKSDILLIYHERYYSPVIHIIKRIKHVPVIYEVEEIYTMVANMKKTDVEKEINGLKCADAYLLSNNIMEQRLGFTNKPSIILYGSYHTQRRLAYPKEDGMIHVLYAGTLSPIKSSAVKSIKAAKFLDSNYHLHILGYGSKQEIELIKQAIMTTTKEAACKITYDGFLEGEEYIRFLQSCHIGLNPQNSNDGLDIYSFPSKILIYMANGLHVVSNRIPALEQSRICNCVIFTEDDTAKALAAAIKSVDVSRCNDDTNILDDMNQEFINEIDDLIQRLSVNKSRF